jgi:predicted AlkP superfamily phosphohydrolase/phosphomutase
MLPPPTKVLFLALDAADKDLIQEWSDAGLLPTLQALRSRAAWGTTQNPTGVFVGAIWPSFFTCVSPAQHTYYAHEQLSLHSYDSPPHHVRDIQGEPFWEVLSQAGKKLAVIDVPKATVSRDLRGVHVVDWITHDRDYPVIQTFPPELGSEVLTRFGSDPMGKCDGYRYMPAQFIKFREQLVQRVNMKVGLATDILKQGGWDCFMTVFSESHCVGHQCWRLHDAGHPGHDPALTRAAGDPIKDVYIALDAALGSLLEHAGPDTHVIVLASHGMGPHYDATYLLDRILERIESANGKAHVSDAVQPLWRRLPYGLRKFFSPLTFHVKTWLDSRRRFARNCFQAPNNDVYGGIRINLVGREPAGQIKPGREYEIFCTELIRDLHEFVNLDTGKPLVKQVLRSAELFQGQHLDLLPDLLIEWNREDPIRSVHSPKTGKIEGEYIGCRSGDHKSEGIFFMTGPSIKPGPIEQPVSIMDFGPTIAALLGVQLANIEGKSILPWVTTAN